MNYLVKELAHISKIPDYGSEEYKNWVAQNNFVDFLHNLNNLNSIVLYAGAPFPFIYGVLVPEPLLAPPNVDDLEKWDCDPFSSWGVTTSCGKQAKVYLSDPLDHSSSKILEHGEKILFVREFDGRQEQPFYIELSQKFTHSFDLHYVHERNAYCRFDKRGDVEDVVKEFLSSEQNDCEKGRVVTVLRRDLDEYMAITRQAMVLLYDSTRYEPKKFGGWQNCDVKKFEKDPEIYYKMGENPGTASYLRGFQIIRSRLSKKDILMKYGICQPKHRKYETFIAHDWKNNKVCECSCDPRYLGIILLSLIFPMRHHQSFSAQKFFKNTKGIQKSTKFNTVLFPADIHGIFKLTI
jgi:hypothetical protein